MSTEFFENYRHKLLQVSEIEKLIGPFPRKSKAILCHGVFDVVHPGHVRHLAYAKSKAEILIASVTADRFIKKGIYRPHIPEVLRALNLAAFEMVDYVMIDEHETPIETLKNIKPDFFAKGFEYSKKIPEETVRLLQVQKDMTMKQLIQFPDLYFAKSHYPLELSQRAFDHLWRMCESYELWCKETKNNSLIKLNLLD